MVCEYSRSIPASAIQRKIVPCHSYSVPMQLSCILVVIRCIRTRMGVTVPQNCATAVRGCASYRPRRSNVFIHSGPNDTLHKGLLHHLNVYFLAVISYVLTIASSYITIAFVLHVDEYLRPRPELDLGSLDGVECRPKYGRIHLHRRSGHERCLSMQVLNRYLPNKGCLQHYKHHGNMETANVFQ